MIKLKDILIEDCWKGYKQVGMKKKGQKYVPNCVPVEEALQEDAYNDFFTKEQEYFVTKPSYQDYIKNMEPILPKADKKSIWLYNHHAAELAWEDGKTSEAKKHIDVAVKDNPFQNSVTFVLDYIINNKGTKSNLIQSINDQITDSEEKKTALKLANDAKYGGKLKP